MRRTSGIVAMIILLGMGCAKRSTTAPESASAPPAAPFTNEQLVSELRRQGIGASGSGAASGTEGLPEIAETARGVVVTLPSTFFAFGSHELDVKARAAVDQIARVMNNPRAANRRMILEGHTDNVGTEAYNLTLSRNRAGSVAREFAKQGMRSDRITVEAYGESRPIAPNRKPDGADDPVGHAKNRRVEAVIPN